MQNPSFNNNFALNICECKSDENYKSNPVSDVTCYAENIYRYLREAEKRRFKLNFNSVQACSRPELISILMEAVKVWNLSNQTLFLAAYLLDIFMDVYAVSTGNLKLLALSCLILADKVEGSRAGYTLKYNELAHYFQCPKENKDFKKFEIYIFETFKADFTIPTILSFADYFIEHCITIEDVNSHETDETNREFKRFITHRQFQYYLNAVLPKLECYSNLWESVKNLFGELINLCLYDLKLFNVLPSLLAAACVAGARQLHCLQPYWTNQLEAVTKYTTEDIYVLKETIVASYEKNTINYLKLKVNEHENGVLKVNNGYEPAGVVPTNQENVTKTKVFKKHSSMIGNQNFYQTKNIDDAAIAGSQEGVTKPKVSKKECSAVANPYVYESKTLNGSTVLWTQENATKIQVSSSCSTAAHVEAYQPKTTGGIFAFAQNQFSTNMTVQPTFCNQTDVPRFNTTQYVALGNTSNEHSFLTYTSTNQRLVSDVYCNNFDQQKNSFSLTSTEQSEFDSLGPEFYNLLGPTDSKQTKSW